MIKVENVTKEFIKQTKNTKEVFKADNNISFEAKDGEIVGILGPNGAGKTTLLRMIAGVLEPTSGTIKYDDMDILKNDIKIKRELAFLSGNTKLYQTISTYELLKMCGEIYNVDKNIIEDRIIEIANILDINAFLHNRISKLSTGQTQKVNIARCMLHDPKYYILDEATSGLDIISSQIILNFIKDEKKKGKTILYSTHYMEEAENICDRVILINKGEIISTGTPEAIKKKTKTTNLRDAFFKLLEGGKNEK